MRDGNDYMTKPYGKDQSSLTMAGPQEKSVDEDELDAGKIFWRFTFIPSNHPVSRK